jgi:hypothetical protein
MPEAAHAARSYSELLNFDDLSVSNRCDDKLRDTFPRLERDGSLTEIDEDDLDFTPKVRINRTRRID